MTSKVSLMQSGKSYLLHDYRGRPLTRANRFLEAIEHRGLSGQTVRAYGYDLLYFLRWIRASKKTWRRFMCDRYSF